MARDKVKQDMHLPVVSLSEQSVHICIRPVPGSYLFIIFYIISGILERRLETRIDPQGIAAQILNIVKFVDNPVDIADPVLIGILE